MATIGRHQIIGPLTSGHSLLHSPCDHFADSLANWNGSATVLGNPDNADLYSNGDLNLSGGGGVYGNFGEVIVRPLP